MSNLDAHAALVSLISTTTAVVGSHLSKLKGHLLMWRRLAEIVANNEREKIEVHDLLTGALLWPHCYSKSIFDGLYLS